MKIPKNHKALKVDLLEKIDNDTYIYHHPNGVDCNAVIQKNGYLNINDFWNRSPFYAAEIISEDECNDTTDKEINEWLQINYPEYKNEDGDWPFGENEEQVRKLIDLINKEWRKHHPIVQEKFTCEESSALSFLKS